MFTSDTKSFARRVRHYLIHTHKGQLFSKEMWFYLGPTTRTRKIWDTYVSNSRNTKKNRRNKTLKILDFLQISEAELKAQIFEIHVQFPEYTKMSQYQNIRLHAVLYFSNMKCLLKPSTRTLSKETNCKTTFSVQE